MGLIEAVRNRIAPQRNLTAAAQRINLDDRQEAHRARTSKNEAWQNDAWAYRDSIGEVRTAVGFLRNTSRRIRLIPGWIPSDGGTPIPLADAIKNGEEPLANQRSLDAANDILARLSGDTGSHADLLEPFAENLEVPGEGILVGYLDELGSERWEFRSKDEVRTDAAGTTRLVDDPDQNGPLAGVELSPDAWAVRIWQPHPRYRGQADSPMRALLNPCEELLLAERTMRSADRSRLAGAGLLLMPSGTNVKGGDVDEQGNTDDVFTSLTKAAVASLQHEGDARSVVPIIAEVPGETIEKGQWQHLTFDRPLDKDLPLRVERALRRLAQGLDVPPEIILGLADVNHWTAWQIDEGSFKHHVAPLVERMADGLTAAVYRTMLETLYAVPMETVARMVVWYDATAVTTKPNRTQDAKDAHNALALSDEALLDVLGFDPETDAPDEEELLRRVAANRGAIDPVMMDWIVQKLLAGDYPGLRTTPPGQISVGAGEHAQEVEAENPPASTAPVPGEVVEPEPDEPVEPEPDPTPAPDGDPTPDSEPEAVSAAGEPQRQTMHRLVAIERSLRDRIQAAADEAVFRAIERAGNRLRSRANKDAEARAMLDGVPAHLVAATLGAQRATMLATDAEILETAFERLESQYTDWTRAAAREALLTAARAAGRELSDEEVENGLAALDPDIVAGWGFLATGLATVTARRLYDLASDDTGDGEFSGAVYVDPSLVRGSLTTAGGAGVQSAGVLADGTAAIPGEAVAGLTGGLWLEEFLASSGVGIVGYEWVYGISRRNFPPHLSLDGVVFANYGAPELANPTGWPAGTCAPGDHRGCHCDAAPIYENGLRGTVAQVGDATYDDSVLQVNRDIAASDEAAGRYGWPSTTPIDVVSEADRVATRRPSQE